jgi:hypothetical protein
LGKEVYFFLLLAISSRGRGSLQTVGWDKKPADTKKR